LGRTKGRIFIFVLAGGFYIDMYKEVYGRYPFILNNRVFKRWFPHSHLVEGAVNVHRFRPASRPSSGEKPKILFFDKEAKGANHIRESLAGISGVKLIGLKDLKDKELIRSYQLGDFFVSWEERPGWSNTSAEAVACGLTVVTNGINCEPFIDRVIVIDDLRSYFSNPENWKIRKQCSMDKFSWERTVDKLLEIFHAT